MNRILALVLGGVLLSGCQTQKPPPSPPEPPRGYLNTMPGNADRAGLPPARLQAATAKVLDAHHFAPPRLFEGSGGLAWAVSPRPRSATEVSLALVQANAKGEVVVEIVGYVLSGSGWALVEHTEPIQREAMEMQKQIQDQLPRSAP